MKELAGGRVAIAFIVGACSILGGCGANVPDKPGPTAKADAIAYYQNIMAAVGLCDARGDAVSAASKSGDIVWLYESAENMQGDCLAASSSIKDVEVPVSVGKAVHAKLTKASEVCKNAYQSKWWASKSLKEALSGDRSIPALAALKSDSAAAARQTLGCVSELMGSVMQAGATAGELR